MSRRPAICVVGTGAIAHDHMDAFSEMGVHPRWTVSRRSEAAEEFATQWSFDRWGTDLGEALEDPTVSLVLVASPSPAHAEQAAAALDAGKDVIVEIPAGLALKDVEGLLEGAEKAGRRVFVCHTMRSFPGIREVKRRVAAAEFDIAHVTGSFAIPRRQNQGFSGVRSWVDDLFWHHACHQVDATLWVMGRDDIGSGHRLAGEWHPELGMVMDLGLGFTCGNAVVSHSLSYNADILLWEIRFAGRDGVLVFRNGALLDEGGNDVIAPSSIRDLTYQNSEILAALASGMASHFDLEAALPSYRALDRLDSSPVSGQ